MQRHHFWIRALVLVLMSLSMTTYAGVYKWVDDKGVVHFGDRPPPPSSTKAKGSNAQQVIMRNPLRILHITVKKPIIYKGDALAKVILLDKLTLDLQSIENNKMVVGSETEGKNCTRIVPLVWSDKLVNLKDKKYTSGIMRQFIQAGYRIHSSDMFGFGNKKKGLLLTAKIVKLKINRCISNDKKTYKAAAYARIKWELTSKGQTLYDVATEAALTRLDKYQEDAVADTFYKVVVNATRDLLADKYFVKHMKGKMVKY